MTRTSLRRHRRPGRRGATTVIAAIATLALVATAAGCGVRSEASDHPIERAQIPDALADPTTSTTTTTTTLPDRGTTTSSTSTTSTTTTMPAVPWTLTLYFVRGDRLVRVRRVATREPSPDDIRLALLSGPLVADARPDLRSPISVSGLVTAVAISGDLAQVTVSRDFATTIPGTTEQVLAFGQLVFTMTSLPGIGRVTFATPDGSIPALLPGQRASDQPVTQADYSTLLAPGTGPATSTLPTTTTVPTTVASTTAAPATEAPPPTTAAPAG